MNIVERKIGGKLYNGLYEFSKQQFSDIDTIIAAYSETHGKIFGIDYIRKDGIISLCPGTAVATKKFIFTK